MTDTPAALDAVLDGLVAQSERMLAAAKEGDWEFVTSAEVERREGLESFFQRWRLAQEGVTVEAVRRLSAYILEIDGEIKELADVSKQEIYESLSQLSSSKQAAKAYIKNSV